MQAFPLLPHPFSQKEASLKNPLALAFIGDTVWDLLVRTRLLSSSARVHALHRAATTQVNAGAQAQALERVQPLLTEEEAAILRRGKNANARHSTPKNQNPVAYSHATGLEAVVGYLYLTGQHSRLMELFDIALPMP